MGSIKILEEVVKSNDIKRVEKTIATRRENGKRTTIEELDKIRKGGK